MDKYELQKRLKSFAHRCVLFARDLPRTPLGNYFHGQLIRSAFSAAANYRSACIAQSRASFIAKLSIAFEEADESSFWVENILDLELINKERILPLHHEGIELAKILGAARKNSR